MLNRRSAGVTLVELIVAMVIVGVALAGAVAAFTRADIGSANPAVAQQMAAIADSMMEEILLKPFNGGAPASTARKDKVKLDDYDAYASNGIYDLDGNAVPGLEAYRVQVSVARVAGGVAGVPADDTRRIQVTVSHAGMDPLVLTGWRTQPLLP
jgi:MSHA pilin protein MshD